MQISRRDFLKLMGAFSGGMLVSSVCSQNSHLYAQTDSNLPNIILIVLDAMSAENLSLYGYQRETTPNFKRFAEQANVYHNHYSAGNYTVPGTASLLTGLYPWTHRAINLSGLVARNLVDCNVFTTLRQKYHTFAYSQNNAANFILNQFADSIETYLPPDKYSVEGQVLGQHFTHDLVNASRSFEDFLTVDDAAPASLLFGTFYNFIFRRNEAIAQAYADDYPDGLPDINGLQVVFRVKDVFDGVWSEINQLKPPSFAYFHLWPPHSPYRPTEQFTGIFNNNWKPDKKDPHILGGVVPQSHLNIRRLYYDEYIANVDAEFGILLDRLQQNHVLDNSYVILTSDHGESFERGVDGHITPLLYEPLVHIPLIISAPKQQSRRDIHISTSSVDVLPTLLNLAGIPIPNICEGQLLPGLGGVEQPDRSIYAVEAKSNPAFSKFTNVSVMLRKGKYKMTCYKRHQAEDIYELYDMEDDQEEIKNLYPSLKSVSDSMREEILSSLDTVNSAYQR